ncbi:TPA: cysteine desulfurase NifS [Candidatus Nomurabacteria bacterium]|nr:cysteine desulfurase NifS [Candidatus Nomurabacteria bacterium]
MKTRSKIYLDHAATTPTHREVLDAMLPYFGDEYGNPSSLYSSGRKSHAIIEKSRQNIANILGVEKDEIIFTASGTEGDNLAILGIARANREYGNHILISSIEHKAVIEPAKQLEKEGFVVEYIPVDNLGMVDVEDVLSRITEKTILISVMYANNEIGTVQPIAKIGKFLKEARSKEKGVRKEENSRREFSEFPNEERRTKNFPIFHTDACQAVGYLPLDIKSLGVDALTLNGSKIYGPKGIGVLYKNKNVKIEPIIFGGGQERGLRSGTENLPAIVGFDFALSRVEERREKEFARLTEIRDYFIEGLRKNIPDLVLNGHPTSRLPNNVHISIPGIEGESMLLMLDELGIQASTGSACSASDLQVSHVLVAIKQDVSLMHGSLRFSLGETTTTEDCDYVISSLFSIVKKLRTISPIKNHE